MKKKIIGLLICTLLITSVFSGFATAKNLVNINTRIAQYNVELIGTSDLIKITDENPSCDIDNNFVVFGEGAYIYIYNIKTEETDEVNVGGNIVFPKISENKVVFYDFSYMGFKMYNINTGEKTDLIVTNWQGGGTDAFQIFSNHIVYENTDSDIYGTEIYLYNIATGENIQLTNSPGEDYSENPCIYENIVAWQLNEDNQIDIVMYNIDSKEYTRVTNTTQFELETFPSIYENNIAYSYYYVDKINGTTIYGLKMYNIVTEYETTLFIEEEPTAGSPEIFGNIIIYSENNSLYLYNLDTTNEISIYESYYLMQPWNLNGNYVLFTILNEGVYLYKYNNTPDPPIIDGPTSGKPNIEYMFILNSVDPDGDDVRFIIDWGDGDIETTSFTTSGTNLTVSHLWSEKGTYSITARAEDGYGALSDWSEPLVITMPRDKTINNLLLRFLESFPFLHGLLDILIHILFY